jgi:hypothetical protein
VREHLAIVLHDDRYSIVRQIRGTNPNAFVFLVQARLKELGVYDGKSTGSLDRQTIQAINAYCTASAPIKSCNNGPLAETATKVLARAF